MTPILSGLIGAIAAFALVTLANRRQRSGLTGPDGWTILKPGALIKFAILLCTGLVALIAGFMQSGGSTRSDASTQNLYAFGLMLFFAAGALYILWAAYGRTIAWKGDELRVRRAFASEAIHRLSDVKTAARIDARSEYRLTFRDDSNLAISVYLQGARELIDQLPPGVFQEPREDWR